MPALSPTLNCRLLLPARRVVFQARVFAAGALHGQFPPDLVDNLIPKGFQNHFLMVNRNTGAVFSAYWPGFSLLLAPFVWLGIPWACNPTLVAASFLLIGRIARDLIASPLATLSWFFLYLNARIRGEGWDIELGLKGIAARLSAEDKEAAA